MSATERPPDALCIEQRRTTSPMQSVSAGHVPLVA
jgi:hypothetical protein